MFDAPTTLRAALAALLLTGAFGPTEVRASGKVPAGDPCTLIPLADVQKAFPGARAGVRNRKLEEYGSTQCAWSDAKGQVLFGVEERYGSNTALEEAKGEAGAFLDPTLAVAKRSVRYETLKGVAPEAVAFVEVGDPKRGILGDGALLVMRRGTHTMSLMSPVLPRRDRAEAFKVFEELGRIAARRFD